MSEIQTDQGDVTVEPIDVNCDLCQCRATHVVKVDFRSAGIVTAIGHYCVQHAGEVQRAIREGLPRAPGS